MSTRLTVAKPSAARWPKTFAEAVCERFKCAPTAYANKVFRWTLYLRAAPIAWLIHLVNRRYFQPDFDLICRLEKVTSLAEFESEISSFASANKMSKSVLRNWLRIRVSGQRLMQLQSYLFP